MSDKELLELVREAMQRALRAEGWDWGAHKQRVAINKAATTARHISAGGTFD